MRTAVLAFTDRGCQTAASLSAHLAGVVHCFVLNKNGQRPAGFQPVTDSLDNWTQAAFAQYDSLIFVGACGIAVRAIAPHLRSKCVDPAVVVVDEQGRFAIALLSGHLGGANALARQAARILGGEAVITTATDGRGLLAVDDWAREMGYTLLEMPRVKTFAAALLAGEAVGFASPFAAEPLPVELAASSDGSIGLVVDVADNWSPFAETLHAIPRCLWLGLGCRRGTALAEIALAVEGVLAKFSLRPQALAGVGTITLKAQEPGLLAFCRQNQLPLRCFTAEELGSVTYRGREDWAKRVGEQSFMDFSRSDFVQSVTGVDGVCERAALALAQGGPLIVPKQRCGPVTVALAVSDWRIRWKRMEEQDEENHSGGPGAWGAGADDAQGGAGSG